MPKYVFYILKARGTWSCWDGSRWTGRRLVACAGAAAATGPIHRALDCSILEQHLFVFVLC